MYRFYISPDKINGQIAVIDADQARHIEKVLRLQRGDLITAFDGQGNEYDLCLLGRQEGELVGEIHSVREQNNEPAMKIALVQGLAKGDKMDSIIQKAVEIGVTEIYPLISQHSVVKLDADRAGKKVDRWQIIAREACKQCRRNAVPTVHVPVTLSALMEDAQGKTVILLYENEKHTSMKQIIIENRNKLTQSEIYLIIGPEGGFSPEEAAFAEQKGALLAGLGPRILRTETAGLVAAAILLYEMGDLQ